MNYRFDDLRALLALDRTKSFNRGAELLHITQSAFSRRIAQIESDVGGRLVERSTRSVALSRLGQDLVREAKLLVGGLDEAMLEAGRCARGESGRITVACLTTVAHALLPKALSNFRQLFPEVRLQLHDDTAQRVLDAVVHHEVEFGVGVSPGPMLGLHVEGAFAEEYVLVCTAEHPLSQMAEVRWSSLAEWRPVTLRTPTTQQINEKLAAAGIQPPWFDEVGSLSSMLALLRTGMTVGVVPEMALKIGFGDLIVRPMIEPRCGRSISIFRRSEAELSAPAGVFWRILVAELSVVANRKLTIGGCG